MHEIFRSVQFAKRSVRLTDNRDHPSDHVRQRGNPNNTHEERDRKPFAQPGTFAIRNRQHEQEMYWPDNDPHDLPEAALLFRKTYQRISLRYDLNLDHVFTARLNVTDDGPGGFDIGRWIARANNRHRLAIDTRNRWRRLQFHVNRVAAVRTLAGGRVAAKLVIHLVNVRDGLDVAILLEVLDREGRNAFCVFACERNDRISSWA